MQEEILINKDRIELAADQMDDISEAIKRLSNSSEEQFEELKKEKWFNRLFDIVTFSQKKNIRVADQISSLAQAQEILVQMLLRLSNLNPEISNAVLNAQADILTLSQQNIRLEHQIIRLQDSLYKKVSGVNLSNFTVYQSQILYGCLQTIANSNESSSEEQLQFTNIVIPSLNTDQRYENSFELIEELDSESVEAIAYCCLEYIFLLTCDINAFTEYENIIDEFDLGKKTIARIKNNIQNNYRLRGIEGLLSKYSDLDSSDMDEQFYIMFEDFDDDSDLYYNYDNENISEQLTISEGETRKFYHKNILLSADIICSGNLVFEECLINYNVREFNGRIQLNNCSKLKMAGCKVVCSDFTEQFFITGKNETRVSIEDTEFVDCSYFLHGELDELYITNCKLYDLFINFIDISGGVTGIVIVNNMFTFSHLSEIYHNVKPNGQDSYIHLYRADNKPIRFINNYVNMSKEYLDSMNDNDLRDFIEMNRGGIIENNTFIGLPWRIGGTVYQKNYFSFCKDCIYVGIYIGLENVLVEDCIFDHCSDIITTSTTFMIKKCQFNNCENRLFEFHSVDGGTSIEDCVFYNYTNNNIDNPNNFLCPKGGINFSWFKDSKHNTIKNCVFNGVQVNYNQLITVCGGYLNKIKTPAIDINNCEYKNCAANNGKLFETYIYEKGLLGKQTSHQIISVNDCSGLSHVGSGEVAEVPYSYRMETVSGERIGAEVN